MPAKIQGPFLVLVYDPFQILFSSISGISLPMYVCLYGYALFIFVFVLLCSLSVQPRSQGSRLLVPTETGRRENLGTRLPLNVL